VEERIAEGLVPAGDFPFGPLSGDHLMYWSDDVVDYQARSPVMSLDGGSIRGVAIYTKGDLLVLELRLPHNLNDLAPIIMRQFRGGN
jgi:hypothetical protein